MVRAIDDEGSHAGIMLVEKALELARSRGLDLVAVDPESDPPVCRIMDYGKYKYRQKKRTQKTGHQHAGHLKEVRITPAISEHDLGIKLRHAREFLEGGDRVLLSMFLKGREMSRIDRARKMFEEIGSTLEDIGKVEQQPRMEGRRINMVFVAK
jgi:translation initiation factor IF-3